jgi:hypothetical protein
LDQASKLSASRPVLSVGMLKFIELVSVLCGRVRFLKTDAVVHELLRLPHSGAACILAGNYRAPPSRREAL